MIRVFYRPCGASRTEQHTAAYELLDAAVVSLGYAPAAVAKTEAGKPYFPDLPTLFFSIAHTEGYAVVALGDSPCGVDIEPLRPLPERVRKRFLGGADGEEAVRRWTERESYGKWEGRGFFAPPPGPDTVKYVTLRALDGYLITVCTARPAAVGRELIGIEASK